MHKPPSSIVRFCLHCGEGYPSKDSRRKYCSRTCSAKANNTGRVITEEQRRKTSESLKSAALVTPPHNKGKVTHYEFKCLTCLEPFYVQSASRDRKYCSRTCCDKRTNTGGYREGSGRSKHGYYNGIYCGSTYELCWVIYSLDNEVEFTRFPGGLSNDVLKYYPDFLLSDKKTIIEIKGYEDPVKTRAKTDLAQSLGYIVKVLYKEDLKEIFLYVKNTYGTSKFEVLYDTHK